MSFHTQTFETRFGTMGDTAEAVFDLVHPKNHKLGLNRPPFGVGGMPLALRYTPDRMLRDRFVEIMGVGRDRTLKLKVEKFDALFMWEFIGPVSLFVYDQTEHAHYDAPIREWFHQALAHGASDVFENDGKRYIGLNVAHFPGTKVPLEDVT
jgi:hypothetical protein